MKQQLPAQSDFAEGPEPAPVGSAHDQSLAILGLPVRAGRCEDADTARSVEPGQLQLAHLQQITDAGYLVKMLSSARTEDELLVSNSLCELTRSDDGALLVIGCLAGISNEPIILGRLVDSVDTIQSAGVAAKADVDGEHVIIRGKESVVFECGKASVTLTAAGKVIIKGDYLCSDAKGVNRVRGGSVQIN